MTLNVFKFRVPGSGEVDHEVQMVAEDGRISVTCTCSGARFGDLCKHRTAFIRGDDSIFANDYDRSQYAAVFPVIAESAIPAAYQHLEQHLDLLDAQRKDLSAEAVKIKKKFASLLTEGM